MPGGVAVLDYNNDGCMDIFYANGAEIPSLRKTGPAYFNRLFRNRCDGTFEDVTAEVGLAGEGYAIAAAAGDFDNDGFPDLFVAGVHRNVLYHNVGGRRFEDITISAGVGSAAPQWSVSAGWFDYDNDGWLDLFVCCEQQASRLYRNLGNGTFGDVTAAAGLYQSKIGAKGVAWVDHDNDGYPDLFVNYLLPEEAAQLFQNNRNGTFTDVTSELGSAGHLRGSRAGPGTMTMTAGSTSSPPAMSDNWAKSSRVCRGSRISRLRIACTTIDRAGALTM